MSLAAGLVIRNWLQIANASYRIFLLVFNEGFITEAFHLLVDHLLPMTHEDYEAWQEDPEEWLMNSMDSNQAWSFDFRVSSDMFQSEGGAAVCSFLSCCYVVVPSVAMRRKSLDVFECGFERYACSTSLIDGKIAGSNR